MLRFVFFISFCCSVALNVYLFMQLNVDAIERNFQQANKPLTVLTQVKTSTDLKTKAQDSVIDKSSLQGQTYNLKPVSDNTQGDFSGNAPGYNTVKNIDNTKAIQTQVSKIKQAINNKNYTTASFLINKLASEQSVKSELIEVKQFWLQATESLIKQQAFSDAEESISAYLAFQQDDMDFLHQQVELYWQQQQRVPAIRFAYEMQYHVFTEGQKSEVVNFARNLVQSQVDQLLKNELWLELREFVDQIIIFDPEYLHLQWLLARTQYQLGEFEYARDSVEDFLQQPNYKIKAKALLVEIEAALRKPESIPLNRQGEHFIVDALIDNNFQLSLMIDTGASISLISEGAFDALNRDTDVTFVKDIQLNTAGGKVTASIYQVSAFSIQGYELNNFIFAVSPFVSEQNDGLLGMNFLRSFDFHIDQNNSLLFLTNK